MKAKVLTDSQLKAVLAQAKPMMRVCLLFSFKCGLRAAELAALDWSMVLDAEGEPSEYLDLPAVACKGKHGAGRIPLAKALRTALVTLRMLDGGPTTGRILHTVRFKPLSADAIRFRLDVLFKRAGLVGVSSHSGRRTYATKLAPKVNLSSLQRAMRHVRASTTLEYVDPCSDALLVAAILAV